MIDAQTVQRIFSVTQEQAASLIAQVDQAQFLQEALNSIAYEVWDRTSDINGTPAAVMLARDDVNEMGTIYLLRNTSTGRVIYFQPHEPCCEGFVWMTPETAAMHGEQQRQELCSHIADERTLRAIAVLLAS
jgi:hypothetical protein